MVDGLPVSLAKDTDVAKVLGHLRGLRPHGVCEPVNPVYLPPEGSPRVLMRYFDRDVLSMEKARAAGVYNTIERAVTSLSPEAVLKEIEASQLRGRGGAGFPTATKLRAVATAPVADGSGRRFVVVNFDEGDAGSYIDKELIERDPHTQLEGILLAAYATGAQQAFIYARYEYPRAQRVLEHAIEQARSAGLIGAPLFGTGFACDVRMVRGQGAYICGEETSLLRSIEGVPALVSTRPPFPAQKGLWGCPTAVNNVETIHNLPWIVEHGGAAYAEFGYAKTRGTKGVSLNTRVKRPGMYEVELGTTLRQLIFDVAGGMAEGQEFLAVQVGGPLGGILPEHLLDTPLDCEAMAKAGGILGHAGVVVYSEEDNLVEVCRGLMAFCAVESCGKCFPCRIGSVRGTELFDQMMETGVTDARLSLLAELCETMKLGSLCALGGMIPLPIESLLTYFPEQLERYRKPAGAKLP
jgi:formate dehydrogenase iron-sulfur subunit